MRLLCHERSVRRMNASTPWSGGEDCAKRVPCFADSSSVLPTEGLPQQRGSSAQAVLDFRGFSGNEWFVKRVLAKALALCLFLVPLPGKLCTMQKKARTSGKPGSKPVT